MIKRSALLLCFFSISAYSETIKLSEEVLPELVASRNGRVLSSKAIVEASQTELGHLRRSFLPEIQLDLGQESVNSPRRNDQHSYGFGSAVAEVNLFNGGRDSLREDILKSRVKRSEAQLSQSKFNLLTRVRRLYWEMIFQKEVINVLETALTMNEKNLSAALKKIRNNLATSTDSIDFNQTKIQFEQDIKKARILLGNSMREMTSLLHHPSRTEYEVPDSILHEQGHTLDKFSKSFEAESHREVLSLDASYKMDKFESELKSRWWTPQLDVYAGKIQRFKKLDQDLELDREEGEVYGVKLTFFFDGFKSQNASVADSYRARARSLLKHQRTHEIEMAYANSYELYELNHDLVHSAEENNKLARRYYDNVWGEYTRGVKNSPDVLQAFQRVITSRLRYAEIKRDYQVARAEILGFLQE